MVVTLLYYLGIAKMYAPFLNRVDNNRITLVYLGRYFYVCPEAIFSHFAPFFKQGGVTALML